MIFVVSPDVRLAGNSQASEKVVSRRPSWDCEKCVRTGRIPFLDGRRAEKYVKNHEKVRFSHDVVLGFREKARLGISPDLELGEKRSSVNLCGRRGT